MSQQKLVLGTVQFGLFYGVNNCMGVPSLDEVGEILRRARQAGCWTLDTAEAYGDANQKLSRIFAGLSADERARYRIIAKFHCSSEDSMQDKWQMLQKNFQEIQIECFQFHRLQDLSHEHRSQLRFLKDAGAIQKVGVSLYTNDEILAACEWDEVDVLQIPYNLLDNFSQRASVVSEARRRGKEIHGRSAFLQGLFFRDPQALSEPLQPLKSWLERLQNLSKQNYGPGNAGIARLALNYALGEPLLDRVLVGVDCADHWSELEEASRHPLPPEIRQQVNAWRVEQPRLLSPTSWS